MDPYRNQLQKLGQGKVEETNQLLLGQVTLEARLRDEKKLFAFLNMPLSLNSSNGYGV